MSESILLIQATREARRLRAIEAIQQGLTQSHVAAMLGISSASVSNWALRFRSGGVAALLARPRGRPLGGRIPARQAAAIRRILTGHGPDEVGLSDRLWTWRSVQSLVFRRCSLEISRWSAVRYLAGWGFRPPAPIRGSAPTSRACSSALKLGARRAGCLFYVVARTPLATDDERTPMPAAWILWALGARGEAAFLVVPARRFAHGLRDFVNRLADHADARPCVVVAAGRHGLTEAMLSRAARGKTGIVVESLDMSG